MADLMIMHILLSFARTVVANKAITVINVLSLGLGLAVFSIAFLYVQRELTFDRAWPNAERIHRLVVEQRGLADTPDGFYTRVSPREAQALQDYFSEEIERATRLIWEPIQVGNAGSNFGVLLLTFADPAFADIFPMEVLEGSLAGVLGNPGMIALSEARAEVLGDAGRVGQRLRLRDPYSLGEQEFEVGAIFRLPERTVQSIDMLVGINDHTETLFVNATQAPWERSAGLWFLLSSGVRTEQINAAMPLFVENAIGAFREAAEVDGDLSNHLFYQLQPIVDVHLNPRGFENDGLIFGDKAKVATFAAVGLLVLLVGCANSASLSFATALRRQREVGIRKASGAGKSSILLHYLSESVLLALAACGLALALQELLVGPAQALLNIEGEISQSLAHAGLLLGIALLMGLINGAYPAFVLSELRPQSVLRSDLGRDGRRSFRPRALLIAAQFGLSVMLLAGASTLYAQLIVARAQPLGYDHRNLLYFQHPLASGMPNSSVLVNSVLNLPGVVAAIPLVTVPPNMNLPLNVNAASLVAKQERETEVQATRLMIVEDFPDVMKIPLLAGRVLDAARDSRSSSNGLSAVVEHTLINRRAAQALGFASPERAVDQLIYLRRSDAGGQISDTPLRIVGVLEDNLYSSIHRRPVPEFYALPPNNETNQYLLRYEPTAASEVRQRVAELYQGYGVQPFFEFIESRIEAAFSRERSESRLLLIAAGLALVLSCIGLYGLAATIMSRNVKEVGVRKVMGGSTANLLRLFLWRFSHPVLLGSLIAWPLASWFVLRWIQRFPYQLDLAWLPALFLGATVLVLLIAWLTVAGVTTRAAMRPAIESLRYE